MAFAKAPSNPAYPVVDFPHGCQKEDCRKENQNQQSDVEKKASKEKGFNQEKEESFNKEEEDFSGEGRHEAVCEPCSENQTGTQEEESGKKASA
ncbi:MAG: hypothetical protein ABSF97_07275 [Candidatus Sulfotelmatobacter sp.]